MKIHRRKFLAKNYPKSQLKLKAIINEGAFNRLDELAQLQPYFDKPHFRLDNHKIINAPLRKSKRR